MKGFEEYLQAKTPVFETEIGQSFEESLPGC